MNLNQYISQGECMDKEKENESAFKRKEYS